jgi:hypothetical protein
MSSMKALREKVKCSSLLLLSYLNLILWNRDRLVTKVTSCLIPGCLQCLCSCLKYHCVQIPSLISFGCRWVIYLGVKIIYNRPPKINLN